MKNIGHDGQFIFIIGLKWPILLRLFNIGITRKALFFKYRIGKTIRYLLSGNTFDRGRKKVYNICIRVILNIG